MLFDVIAERNSLDTVEDGTAANDDDLNEFEPDPEIIAGLIRETREMLRSGNSHSDNGSERGRGRGQRIFKKT